MSVVNAGNMGNIQERAGVPLNCVRAEEDRSTTRPALFDPLTDPDLKGVRYGEILFTRKRAKFGQQPSVQSVLNGVRIRDTQVEDNAPPEKKRAKFAEELRVVGISNKTILAKDKSADPVALVGGLITVTNTSQKEVRAGDLIIATVPTAASGAQTSITMPVSDGLAEEAKRRVLETTPARELTLAFTKEDFQTDSAHYNALLDVMEIVVEQTRATLERANGDVREVARGVAGEDLVAKDARAYRFAGEAVTARQAAQGLMELVATSDDLYAVRVLKQANAMVKASRSLLNAHLRNMVGVAASDARPRYPFDLIAQPGFAL